MCPRFPHLTSLLVTAASFAAVVALGASAAQAQSCLDDVTGRSNNCTANDVRITAMVELDVLDRCVGASDTAEVQFDAELLAGTDRYDIGMFFALDGGDAETGICVHEYLPPPLAAPPGHDPLSGSGPFANLETTRPADVCGDVVANETTNRSLPPIVVACSDLDLDGLMEVSSCVSWDNNTNGDCTELAEALPGTKSKCNCEVQDTTISVPELSLVLSCVPTTARPGELVTCTATLSNSGLGAGEFIDVAIDYPESHGAIETVTTSGSDTASDDGDVLLWTPGGAPATDDNVPSGSTFSVTYTFRVDEDLTGGTSFSTTATVRSEGNDQPLSDTATNDATTTDAVVVEPVLREVAGGRLLEWRTASEIGTVGFHVEALDPADGEWRALGDGEASWVDGSLSQPGAVYRVPLTGPAETATVFRLVERTLAGGTRVHGPLFPSVEPGSSPALPRSATVDPVSASSRRSPDVHVRMGDRPRLLSNGGDGSDAVAIEVRSGGLQAIAVADLAPLLGVEGGALRARVLRGGLSLTHRGASHHWIPSAAGDYVYFWAPDFDEPTSAVDVYVLERRRGSTMATRATAPDWQELLTSHRDSLRVEEDVIALTSSPLLQGDEDFWFQTVTAQNGAPAALPLGADAVMPAGDARVAIDVFGFPVGTLHGLRASLDGVVLGEWTLPAERARVELPLPADLLTESSVLELEALDAGADSGGFFVEGVDLQYQRSLVPRDGALVFSAAAAGTALIDGVTDANVILLDVTDPATAVLLTEHWLDPVTHQVAFRVRAGETYALVEAAGLRTDATLRPLSVRHPLEIATGADHVLVTVDGLAGAAEELSDLREGQGVATAVVTMSQIADAYDHGRRTSTALRAFLRDLHASRGVGLTVALVGAGTFDLRDVRGLGTNLVPSLLVQSGVGIFASDLALADVVGDDGVPDFPIGRLPVLSADELSVLVAKLADAEALVDETTVALLVGDRSDEAGSFGSDASDLRSRLSAEQSALYELGVTHETEALRQAIVGSWAEGLDLFVWLGHGGLDLLSKSSVVTVDHVSALVEPSGRLPVVVALTCNVGRFDFPGFDSLGSSLMLEEGAGARAVFAASAPISHERSRRLGRFVADALGTGGSPELGARLNEGIRAYVEAGGDRELLWLYNLIGDPRSPAP